MPVCNKCKKFSNCLTADFCEHCRAKDWDEATVLRFSDNPQRNLSNKPYSEMTHDEILREHGRRYAQGVMGPAMKELTAFLKPLLVVALLIGGFVAYLYHREQGRYIAVVDSFETHETSSGYESIVKFHNTLTNYEATCVAGPNEQCKRFYAGERHQFSSLGGLVDFPDPSSSNKYIAYTETKESVR